MKKLIITVLALFFLSQTTFATIIQSAQSGDWNTPATWQGGVVPSFNDDVTILSGHVVAVENGNPVYCHSTIVNGTLNYLGNNFVIGSYSAKNSPLVVNGTLNIAGNFSSQFKVFGYVQFNTGSTFTMSAGAFFIDGNNGTVNGSVAANTPILDVTNATNFNVTGGTIYIFNPHYHAGGLCIKGAKNFGNTVSFGNNNNTDTDTDFLISQTEKPSFNNFELFYHANTSRVYTTDLSIAGAVSINKGRLINSSATPIRIGRDLNFGTEGVLEGNVEFNGTYQQNINPLVTTDVASAVIKGNVYVNNAERVKIKLHLAIENGQLIFKKGRFDTNNRVLTLDAPPVDADASRYVVTYDLYQEIGTLLVKNVNGTQLFPVGTETGYLPVTITAGGGNFSASVYPLTGVSASQFSTVNAQWVINRTSGTSQANIAVQWSNADESLAFGINRNLCQMYRYNGTNWVVETPVLGTTTSTGVNFTKITEGVSSFPARLAMFAPAAVPVTLVDFYGKNAGKNAHLYWSTATEINNKGFEIQKSSDGMRFSTVGFVAAQAYAQGTKQYTFVDAQFDASSYYRLKQVDLDGSFSHSKVIHLVQTGDDNAVKMYPNPVKSDPLSIEFAGDSPEADVAVYDASGRIVFLQKFLGQNLVQIEAQNWANGLYLVKITHQNHVFLKKMVKE